MLLIWVGFFSAVFVPGLGSGRDPSRQRVFVRLQRGGGAALRSPLIYWGEIDVNMTWSAVFTGGMGLQHRLGM